MADYNLSNAVWPRFSLPVLTHHNEN